MHAKHKRRNKPRLTASGAVNTKPLVKQRNLHGCALLLAITVSRYQLNLFRATPSKWVTICVFLKKLRKSLSQRHNREFNSVIYALLFFLKIPKNSA